MDVRRVNANGEIKWKGQQIFLSEVLIGADVGLLPVGESIWSISFSSVRIGYLDELNRTVANRRPTTTKTDE
jgi:putative transposase